MNIELLQWDTAFFGMKIGRLVLNPVEKFDSKMFQEEAGDNHYDLVYVFSVSELRQINNSNNKNLDLVDVQITMSRPFVKENYLNEPYDLKGHLTRSEIEDCYRIGEETAFYSRFYHEKLIGPQKAEMLYRKWIDNAINKSFADGLFVTRDKDMITGIHLIKTDVVNRVGSCSIIGVNARYRGLNLGRDLWQQANGYWANECDVVKTKVPFSLNNAGSFNFHLKMGFNKIEEVKYIYHFRNVRKRQ